MIGAPTEILAELVRETAERECLRRLVLSKPLSRDAELPRKISARLTLHRGRRVLYFEESYPTGRVRQFALSTSELLSALPPLFARYGQIDLLTSLGDAALLRSAKGSETLRGERQLRARLAEPAGGGLSLLEPLEREPKRILVGNEPFLFALGISDKNGRVHDKRQAKFRQINRFLEYVAELYGRLPSGDAPLLVYDLCCGKSYLSFALYHYLTAVRSRRVFLLGMDLKDDVMSDCRRIALQCGFGEATSDGAPIGMRFLSGDVRALPKDRAPDLVVSLHACDVATDIVLSSAASLGASVILSTPCCHRYLGERLPGEKNSPLSFILSRPKLRLKLAEAATDAIRCLYLEALGYRVDATELVDPDDTPKNTLIRAYRTQTSAKRLAEKRRELRAALTFLLGDGADAYIAETFGEFPKGDAENVPD